MTIRDRAQAALDRASVATAGPWHHCCGGKNPKCHRMVWADADQETPVCYAEVTEHLPGARNARFIAAAREDVPTLAAALLRILSPEMREQIARTLYGGGCLSPGQAADKADDVMRLIERVAEGES